MPVDARRMSPSVGRNKDVILAVLRERHLRGSTNYLIVSLAVADLVIGAVVMPFAKASVFVSSVWWTWSTFLNRKKWRGSLAG